MIAELGFAVERIPTDGNGGTAAARALGAGNNGAITATTLTTTSGTPATNCVANDICVLSTGYWGVLTAAPVGAVITVERWYKVGRSGDVWRNDDMIPELPPSSGTYKVFPASVMCSARRGVRIKKINFVGVAGSTLTIQGIEGSNTMTIDSTAVAPRQFDYGTGRYFPGPITITPNSASIIGHVEFDLG